MLSSIAMPMCKSDPNQFAFEIQQFIKQLGIFKCIKMCLRYRQVLLHVNPVKNGFRQMGVNESSNFPK